VFFVKAGNGLRLAKHRFSTAAFTTGRADISGRYVLGEDPVDDSLDLLRTHVLGGWIGTGIGLAGHGLL